MFYGRADLDLVALLPLQGLDGQNGTAPWVAPATATACRLDVVALAFPSGEGSARQRAGSCACPSAFSESSSQRLGLGLSQVGRTWWRPWQARRHRGNRWRQG